MKNLNGYKGLMILFLTISIIIVFGKSNFAQDDGARAYWNARAGTHILSFQYLPISIGASGSKAFAPGQYIYPNSDINANIVFATYAYHFTLFNTPSAFAVNIVGGSISADFNTVVSSDSLPLPITPGAAISQSSLGFSDPNMQLVVNLFGTPPLVSTVDLLNYEPTFSLDIAAMLAFPIGKYNSEKLVNIGLNRWYGRVALPFKWHFGVFSPGYMSSFELTPAVWLFTANDEFMGNKLENDPLLSLEAHLTHDFTTNFFGSLDVLYQNGFQSKIDGEEVGEKLEIGNVGFAMNYQISDNITIRTSFSSNVFGDDDLDNSMIRIQFVYAWHRDNENIKKLQRGH
jgi:hypothetical protein